MDDVTREIARLMRAPRLTLAAVRSMPGGRRERLAELGLDPGATVADYRRAADAWQRDFDDDADPVRVYVFDASGVAVHAACGAARHGRKDQRR